MAVTPSNMLPLGTFAPSFRLRNTADAFVALEDFKNKTALLVMFICNHCPYVKHLRMGLAQLGKDYADQEVAIVAINSNDAEKYPADNPENMVKEAREAGYVFPYLFDETQDVAKAYKAACTPDFFLFGSDRKLVYRGQFDESRPGNAAPVTGKDLRAAIDAVLAAKPLNFDQRPSLGCNIKWR